MNKIVPGALAAILLASALLVPIAGAATDTEKVAAIRQGLAYLYSNQESGGYWKGPGGEHAATGAAVFALQSQKDKWGNETARYQEAVDTAVAYLLSTANTTTVSTRNDGSFICPGGVASCTGVYWFGNARSTYATGWIAPALAAYGAADPSAVATRSGPLAGMTWADIAQGTTNALAASQSTPADGRLDGGWSPLIPGNGESASASTYSAVVALLFNESIGAVTPEVVRTGLRSWLSNVQNASGAACHQPGVEPCGQAETGGWLLAMKFAGYDLTNQQIRSALTFLNANWQPAGETEQSDSFASPYTMWAVYSGLEVSIGVDDAIQITNSRTKCGGDRETCAWSEDFSHWLVNVRKADGSSSANPIWTDPISAALYINVIGAIRLPTTTQQVSRGTAPAQSAQQPDQSPVAPMRQASALAVPLSSAQAPAPAVSDGKLRPRARKGVVGLSVSDDGNALASAGTDNNIRIWDATTGQQRIAFPGALHSLTDVTFARGGAALASVGRDSVLRVWDAVAGTQLATLSAHEHAIRAVAASPNGSFLSTAGEESRVMLWNLATRKLDKILFGHTDFVNSVVFSPNSRLLAAGDDSARVLLFDVASGKLLFTLRGHSGAIDVVTFSPDGTMVASAGQDTVVRLWNALQGQQLQSLKGHSEPIRAMAFSPDGRQLATAGEDTRILIWNTATGRLEKTLTGSGAGINVLRFELNGRFLASANEAGEVTLWNVIAGVKLRTIKVPGAQ